MVAGGVGEKRGARPAAAGAAAAPPRRAGPRRRPPPRQQPAAAAPRGGEGAGSAPCHFREAVIEVYRVHAPHMLGRVDSIVARWRGREAELMRRLHAKYPEKMEGAEVGHHGGGTRRRQRQRQ
jgi:hypothetical protein